MSVLINENKKMKKMNLLTLTVLSTVLVFTSCSKDDDHVDDCHECHVALMMQDGSEHEHEIGEFCGDELENVEANGYTVVTEFTHMGTTYPVGHIFNASEVHCEEHADH